MDEFLKALREFRPEPPQPIEFRVYYRPEDGSIIGYTNETWPGDYIIVDPQVFHENRFDLRVKNQKLTYPKPTTGKLRPGDKGTACHPQDITIIVERTHPVTFWSLHTNEPD